MDVFRKGLSPDQRRYRKTEFPRRNGERTEILQPLKRVQTATVNRCGYLIEIGRGFLSKPPEKSLLRMRYNESGKSLPNEPMSDAVYIGIKSDRRDRSR